MNILIKRLSLLLTAGNRLHLLSLVLFLLFAFTGPSRVCAQRVALSTNVLEWGVLSPNLGTEFLLNSRLTLQVTASGSPFRLKNDLYFKHFRLQPELKYWFQNLLLHHYVGITAFYSSYDAGMRHKAYTGDAYAAGFTYGYHLVLSRRWNLELSAGAGMLHYRQAEYVPGTEHPQPDRSGWIPAPVKLGVSFVYIIN